MGWTVGGFQGGEGNNNAAEWNVENVFEELDAPSEWYFDTAKKDLYYFHNASSAPPSSLEIAGTKLEQLITITGAGSARGETAAPAQVFLPFRCLACKCWEKALASAFSQAQPSPSIYKLVELLPRECVCRAQ